MNKIILLGHPSSGLSAVDNLLKQSGMLSAKPSKRDGLFPEDITDTLCRAHDCLNIDDVLSEQEFLPIQAGTVWHGLALDLLLGNLDQSLWGWSDPRSIYWLDYWSSLDPHVTFIMVYDHPISSLQSHAKNLQETQLDMAVPRLLENWQAYNGAILRFQSKESKRCLLINAQRAREQLDTYLSELSSRLHGKSSSTLELPSNQAMGYQLNNDVINSNTSDSKGNTDNYISYFNHANHVSHDEYDNNESYPAYSDPANRQQLDYSGNHQKSLVEVSDQSPLSKVLINSPEMVRWFEGHAAIDHHLLHQLLQQYPQALQIYQELEAASSVTAPDESMATNMHPGEAWLQLIQQRQAIADVLLNFYQQMQGQIAQINALEQENLKIENKLDEEINLKNIEQEAKKSAIAAQLFEKQQKEELHKQLQEQLKINQQQHDQQINQLEEKLREAERAIEKAKETALEPTQLKDLEEENELLLNQLHLVQEELERYYLENQDLQKKIPKPKSKPYGAAERIQQQLSYRLGATMIANSRSLGGWLKMPMALTKQIRQYKADLKLKANQKQVPIHAYADAHEAARYQQHLSYKLGQTLIKHGKTPWGWLWMPIAINRTVKNFRKGWG